MASSKNVRFAVRIEVAYRKREYPLISRNHQGNRLLESSVPVPERNPDLSAVRIPLAVD
jgi:hypothetical protein